MGCARGCLAGRASTLGCFPGPFGSKSSGQLRTPQFTCVPMGLPSALGYKYIPEATPVFRLFVAVGGSASIGE